VQFWIQTGWTRIPKLSNSAILDRASWPAARFGGPQDDLSAARLSPLRRFCEAVAPRVRPSCLITPAEQSRLRYVHTTSILMPSSRVRCVGHIRATGASLERMLNRPKQTAARSTWTMISPIRVSKKNCGVGQLRNSFCFSVERSFVPPSVSTSVGEGRCYGAPLPCPVRDMLGKTFFESEYNVDYVPFPELGR